MEKSAKRASKIEGLKILFDSHAQDLKAFHPDDQDYFICPICLRGYTSEALYGDLLSLGHVWPEYLRKKSEKARNMHTLLCKNCNNKAGSHSDKQMQLYTEHRDGFEKGRLEKINVLLYRNHEETPINLNNISLLINNTEHSFIITGRVDKETQEFLDGSPIDQKKLIEVCLNQEPVRPQSKPAADYKPDLVPAGFITSAYLMCFYFLGYRFILDRSLDVVREYIQDSFMREKRQNPIQLNEDDFGIWETQENIYKDPELFFMIPFESGKHVYFQVNYLSYQIRLPSRYQPEYLFPVLQRIIPDYENNLLILREKKVTIPFKISDPKTEKRNSWFDNLLGTPQIQINPLQQ